MELVFVHPGAALVALVGLLPLAAFALVRRRTRRLREALRLPAAPARSALAVAAAIVATALLAGAAAAHPVLLRTHDRLARTDAEAYVVVDVTRSMRAAAGPAQPMRLERARQIARRLRRAVPDVPFGIASLTNRVVPHIFPTIDGALFDSGLVRSIQIESPPPDGRPGALVTALDALAPLQTHQFFAPDARRRVAVVLTDGESRPVAQSTVRALRAPPALEILLVRIWDESERIHRPLVPVDRTYEADAAATAELDAFARAVGGRVFEESSVDDVARELRRRLGDANAEVVGREVRARPLTVWVLALAFAPVGYLLRRRNV